MGEFSLFSWLIVALIAILLIVPVWRILKRMGLSPWLSLLCLVPFAGYILLWIIAFIPWPIEKKSAAEAFS